MCILTVNREANGVSFPCLVQMRGDRRAVLSRAHPVCMREEGGERIHSWTQTVRA